MRRIDHCAKWVLTAAHCIEPGTKSGDVKAKAGATNYITAGTWTPIERVVVHEKYNPKTYENDLALLKLTSPPSGKVIPLADATIDCAVGQPLEVTGWGATSEGGDAERNLLRGTYPTLTMQYAMSLRLITAPSGLA